MGSASLCSFCSFDNLGCDVMPCTLTGSSCCNVTNSCLSTAPSAPNLGSPGSSNTGANLTGLISGIETLGVSIGSIVTGRPVVTNGKGGPPTLGNKPIVTGQIQAGSLLMVGGLALVAVLFIVLNKGE